ncbi:S1/P1 nuclease [Mucilaginibacter aquatilis]|uniref:S1/P1 Nuclease n=1 Tax=Mucilaginibacter aquatilis TaxID=1517760 RepID=A0A6I4I5Q4_9SPHI|nr:S1/P1 nuclease [Mucilaginibacter aquatilis]MVN90450.1 S1/P1 Nuclease [Mucilaginibacter aquatilis]
MKTNLLKKLLIGAAIIYAPLQSMAWGDKGHRIVGQIASSYLTPKARAAVKAILGNESIAMTSTWADFIKSDPSYSYLSSWHYIDFDKPFNYPELQSFLKQDTSVDAYTKMQFMIGELKKKSLPQEKKLLYLRMLIHVVEDVHQPMHTAHTDDKGGNDYKVQWFNEPSNLHSVWDSKLIEFQNLSYTEYASAINFTTVAQRTEWQKEPISKWLFDSKEIAEKIYAGTQRDEKIGYKYNFQFVGILNQQLLKGGVHLAGLLNQIFA